MFTNGLKASFATLLGIEPEKADFEVTLTEPHDGHEQEIIVKTKREAADVLLQKLEVIFSSRGHTQAAMPLRLKSVEAKSLSLSVSSHVVESKRSNISDFPIIDFQLIEADKIEKDEIFSRLFDRKVRESTGNIMQWQKGRGHNNQTIYYYECQSEMEANLRKAQIEIFKGILSHATWIDLYKALAKNDPVPLPVPPDEILYAKKGNGPLSNQLENLLVVRKENEKFVVRFDGIGLVKCVLAPKFDKKVLLEDKGLELAPEGEFTEISVNYSHYMAYMSTLLSEGILLHQRGNQFLPIVYHRGSAIQASTLIVFAIDCSESMYNVFDTLKITLKDLIRALPNSLEPAATTVKLTRFGSRKTKFQPVQFPLTQMENLLAAIDIFNKEELRGQKTAIFKHIVKDFVELKSAMEYTNIVYNLVSDGGDNDSSLFYHPNLQKTDRFSSLMTSMDQAISPPQFFSIEIGDLTEDKLRMIEAATHGKRISVGQKLEKFDVFFKHMKEQGQSRYFLHFVQGALQFKLPAADGEIIMRDDPKHYLEIDKPFMINREEFSAQKADLLSQQRLALSSNQVAASSAVEIKLTAEQERLLALEKELEVAREKYKLALEEQQVEIVRLREENAQMSARAQRVQEESNSGSALREMSASDSGMIGLHSQSLSRSDDRVAAALAHDRLPSVTLPLTEGESVSQVVSHAASMAGSQRIEEEQPPAQPVMLTAFEQQRRESATDPSQQGSGQNPRPKQGMGCTIL